MDERDLLAVPAWQGPARIWVPLKGKAFTSGVLAVGHHILLFTDGRRVTEISRDRMAIRWPIHLLGTGCWISWDLDRAAFCFTLPLPGARRFDPGIIDRAAGILQHRFHLDGPSRMRIVGALFTTAAVPSNLPQGRRIAHAVQARLRGE
jgi:hypothetical protein